MSERLQITDSETSLSVRQQARFTPRGLLACLVLSFYLARPMFRVFDNLLTALQSKKWEDASLEAAILLITVISAASLWFGALNVQILHCDAKHFRIAEKARFRPWRRRSYPTGAVQGLKYGVIRQSQYEVVRGLTFEHQGGSDCLFEYLPAPEADRILQACERFGISVLHDPAMPMMSDIDKRGWLVNPWRPDPPQDHPTKR